MASVHYYGSPGERNIGIYQKNGTATWEWKYGDNFNYWGFAVRPESANMQVEITRQWTTSDKDLNQVEHFIVNVSDPVGREFRPHGDGGMLRFTAIRVDP
ncbi:MAG: hypothetical protein ABI137_04495 [Antricoccus sp.]